MLMCKHLTFTRVITYSDLMLEYAPKSLTTLWWWQWCLVTRLCPALVACQASLSLGLSSKNARVSCHFLLQNPFMTVFKYNIFYRAIRYN